MRQARIPVRDRPQHHPVSFQLIEHSQFSDIREHPAHQLLPERTLHCQSTLPAQGFHAAHVGPLLLELAVEIVCAPGEPEVTGMGGVHIAHGRMHAEQSATDIEEHGFIVFQHDTVF